MGGFILALLLLTCGLVAARMFDPTEPPRWLRLLLKFLLLVLAVIGALFAWVVWEMR
jgi:hypothetical protein